jgi:hypothetical protein
MAFFNLIFGCCIWASKSIDVSGYNFGSNYFGDCIVLTELICYLRTYLEGRMPPHFKGTGLNELSTVKLETLRLLLSVKFIRCPVCGY